MTSLLPARNHASLSPLLLSVDPQDHAALKAHKVPVVSVALKVHAVHAVPVVPVVHVVHVAHKVHVVNVVNVVLKDPAVHVVYKVPVVNVVLQDPAVHADQEVRVVTVEPQDNVVLWEFQALMGLLDHKVLPAYLALPELLACKAHKVMQARLVQ